MEFIDIALAPVDRLKLSAGVSSGRGLYGQAAYQFFGSALSERAIGWSAAGKVDLYAARVNANGDQNRLFGPGGYKWNADLDVFSYGAGLSAGYRFHENIMVFTGVSRLLHQTKLKITQDPSDDGSDPGGHYSREQDGNSSAIGLGLILNISNKFRIVSTYHHHEYDLASKSSEDSLNVSLVFGGQ